MVGLARQMDMARMVSAKGFAFAAFAFLMASLPAESADGMRPPTGALRPAVLGDLKPHPSNSKTYNEFWTYHFVLNGNIQAYLNFSRVNLEPFRKPVCGADFTVLGFRGRNLSVAREYGKKNFIFNDSLHSLKVHDNIWFSGKLPETHRVFFSTRKKDVSYFLDLQFTDIMPGKVWGDGMFHLGASETIGIFLHIPQAQVTGKLAINKDTLTVTGTAYMDHTFQTALAPELVDAGYRYMTQSGPLEVGYFLDPDARYGTKPIGYGLRQLGAETVLLKPVALAAPSVNRAMGVKVPTRLEVSFQDTGKSVMERKQDRLQQSYLHEFSGFTKMAIRNFMGGELITFKGMGTLNAKVPTAYNYFIVD